MNSTLHVAKTGLTTSEADRLLSSEAIKSLQTGSDEVLVTSYHVIRHFITPAICLLSMGALIFTLIFLHRKKLVRITALIYLKFMGFIDLLSLVVLFISSLDYFMPSSQLSAYYSSAFVRSLYGCLLGLLLASNWLMTAQAVERTIAISRPFKAKQIREKHRRIAVTVICVVSVLLTIPTLVLDIMELTRYHQRCDDTEACATVYEYAHGFDEQTNSSRSAYSTPYYQLLRPERNQTQITDASTSTQLAAFVEDRWPDSLKKFQFVQAWLVHFFIFFALPFVFLCLASFCLLSAVKMSGRFVRQHCIRDGIEFRNTLREEARMTALILCLIGAFFICQSPFVAYTACHKVGILSKPSHGHSLLRAAITLALALKSDCTFVFHCWLNQRFAFALRRMLCSFSAKTTSGRCHGSKSYSNDDSHNHYTFHHAQTRSFVKNHAIQHPNRTDELQMRMLLGKVDHKADVLGHLSQRFNRKEEEAVLSKPGGVIQMGIKDKTIAVQSEAANPTLLQKNTMENLVHEKNNNLRITVTLETQNGKNTLISLPKRCCRRRLKFLSENDLYTSCTTTGCSCASSCQATSFCSSFDCTDDTSAHCRHSLTKSFSLPPLNSTNAPFYHMLSNTYADI